MNVVIVGVGGQGTLLASRILGALANEIGCDVKVSEVHGMSQRGGSVVTYVRIGDKINAPLVGMGEADYVLAFEQMEAMRALPYLKQEGMMIANSQQISPMPVITGAQSYPENLIEHLGEKTNLVVMDAYALAQQAGEARAVNLVLLGALCKRTPYDKELWQRALKASIPAKFLEANLRAFELGYQQ